MQVGPLGRPELRGALSISVSVSHARGWILAAIAKRARIGVDIEVVTAVFDQASLVRRACNGVEVDAIAAAPPGERRALVADLWTQKEAALKAHGRGLRDDPRKVHEDATNIIRLRHGITGLSACCVILPAGENATADLRS
ncbi:4'-phosphopantetheinyl transferase superfamily protein [Cryobacterium sp. TMT1-66-1]|uniref:4'-phosphopantetheinyl transferase family protein n=1 Tax=Cryobacterium sp. TMT1-66-1 TaxID=1259242 RepID=UPI00106DCC53|nr:4'-phosphopantetheinyl transferase superfamily protein [Cryobacterium sp. TMT1-66-1]